MINIIDKKLTLINIILNWKGKYIWYFSRKKGNLLNILLLIIWIFVSNYSEVLRLDDLETYFGLNTLAPKKPNSFHLFRKYL